MLAFERRFAVRIPDRLYWKNQKIINKKELAFYTDGFKTNVVTGAGVYCEVLRIMVSLKTNSAKTKILTLNNASTSQVSIADRQIERLNDFQYLGSMYCFLGKRQYCIGCIQPNQESQSRFWYTFENLEKQCN